MAEIKNLLFPLDFGSTSEKVLSYARYMAEKLRAKLYLLFVVEDLSKYANFYVPHSALDNLEAELLEAAKKKMENFIEDNLSDFPNVEGIIKRGDIADEIIKVVEEKDIDMIVMGTHGRKGLEKILLGSVAEQVVKRAPCPVLTINPYRVKIS